MKIRAVLSLLAIAILSVSCAKESLPDVVLSSSAEALEVTGDSNKPAFTLSWKYDGNSGTVVRQYLQFSPQTEFLEPYVASTTGNEYVVTFKDLKKMQTSFGIQGDYILQVRLLVEGDNVPVVYSNKVKINLSY